VTIKQKQCLLAYLGYYTGEIDGIWGQQSLLATERFQNDYRLAVVGIFDGMTEKKILEVIASGEKPKATTTEKKTGTFWDDIKYFKRKEFKCRCGNVYCNGYPAEMHETLIRVGDRVRGHFGATATVSSGLRCKQHNANVGGVSNSRHLSGKAMDFCIKGKTSAQVLSYVKKQPEIRYAYAIDSQFVHMDIL
jgi:peptidoglycan hydrolase-like protein with peptidoglycan-binding domain